MLVLGKLILEVQLVADHWANSADSTAIIHQRS